MDDDDDRLARIIMLALDAALGTGSWDAVGDEVAREIGLAGEAGAWPLTSEGLRERIELARATELSAAERRRLYRIFTVVARLSRLVEDAEGKRARGDLLSRVHGLLGHGAVFVAADGAIVEANERAHLVLARGDGLRSLRGRLVAGRRRDQKQLETLIAHAIDGHAGTVVIERDEAAAPYLVDAVGATSAGSRCVVLLIRDPHARPRGRRTLLQRAYGLTPAEARVADAIADGLSLAEIAERFGVARGTVKNQLKEVFAKVGVRRQAELVRAVSRLTPLSDDERGGMCSTGHDEEPT
jgi:DNA-binding CsgD family transcriptional regulator